ncbi:NuA4-domain-containing protein [Tilletiaria anomala UBC 951]|uniref:Chromatin modification-related protein EAF6 n=1 Tax=Tilletiaria anomala (strain ATCC 24038 / CBS 436.72 / UBC 951) TaxID=1037660 RepID=A0A066VZ39_TILAU|nr:NuA4-domain-containing protein [Tilletiaria anomala UBC 951]KDN46987.1 NuA4-domain-containing protein [Tilletiaria anomala UBC 951]
MSNAEGGASASASGSASGASQQQQPQPSQPPPQSLEEANQRYGSIKAQLKTSLARKRQMDKALIDLETQIYVFEGSYLSSTAASGGNIVKGFDSYLKTTNPNSASMAAIAGGKEVLPEDRMFSASSATYERSLELSIGAGSGGTRIDTATPPPPESGSKVAEARASPAGEKPHKSGASGSSGKLKRKHDEAPSGKNHKKKKAED